MISLFPFRLKSFSLSTYLSIDATTLCALSLLCCLSTPFSMFSVLFYHASLMVNFLFSFFVFLFLHGSAQFSLVIYYFLNSLYYAWFIFSLLQTSPPSLPFFFFPILILPPPFSSSATHLPRYAPLPSPSCSSLCRWRGRGKGPKRMLLLRSFKDTDLSCQNTRKSYCKSKHIKNKYWYSIFFSSLYGIFLFFKSHYALTTNCCCIVQKHSSLLLVYILS